MRQHKHFQLSLADGRLLELGPAPLVMGIVNVTPDSFSDGGAHVEDGVAHAQKLIEAGADIVDIGGESTRPGAEPVGVQQELDRVIPVLEHLTRTVTNPVSIDTYKALVADQAVQSGAAIINDVHGLQREPEIADVVALHKVPVIIMHWDQNRDPAKDIMAELARHFDISLNIAAKAGIADNRIVLDPGFGFGKNLAENYEILRRLGELGSLGYPVLAGTSRKSMIGKLLNVPPDQRLAGTLASNVLAYDAGAHIFRVHDVQAHVHALAVAKATRYAPLEESLK